MYVPMLAQPALSKSPDQEELGKYSMKRPARRAVPKKKRRF